jgi:hypothetical protein
MISMPWTMSLIEPPLRTCVVGHIDLLGYGTMLRELARLSPEERLARTMALCRAATELALAGIRLREGDLPKTELRLHLARLRYGAPLVERVQAYRLKMGR